MTVPAVAPTLLDASVVESVLLQGDLSRLTAPQCVAYYNRVCESLGLNPLTKPFDYLTLNGKTVLYAKRDATEQLRKIHGVSIVELNSREVGGVFVVTAKAQDARQRIDVSTGAVSIGGLKGEALANALMKAETKAKRRVTLSICGLGLLDETEVETIPRAAVQASTTTEAVNAETGEIVEAAPSQAAKPAAAPKAAKDAPLTYTGLITVKPTRKTSGNTTVWDFGVDDQTMSTVAEEVANKVRTFENQRATVTYRPTTKGGILILDISPAVVAQELTAEEVFRG